ncbi:MAG: bifunctional metallophosphatase/5'-nucleotidase [Candidatus Promineifilaceae bacterium]
MTRKPYVLFLLFVLLLGITIVAGSAAAEDDAVVYTLTILHNNDGESQVVNAGGEITDFGGAARFKTVVDNLRGAVTPSATEGVLMISSGDNFLAGPEFNAGVQNGVPFYDTIAMELIGYDAISFGNHDFDFGPDVLADFIDGYTTVPQYVAANLDFSGEPRLQAYVDSGDIAPSAVITQAGVQIGVIGLETPNLPFVSSPRNVVVSDDLVNIVQTEVDALEGMGVDIIILAGHLQSIENDIQLISELSGVDVAIAGGGDELLADAGDILIPGDEELVYGEYPQLATDKDGITVPVVTTSGEYRYVGKLVVGFDANGVVEMIDDANSMPVRVATGTCNDTEPCDDAVTPDPTMQMEVVDPVVAALGDMDNNVIGQSLVDLDGLRSSVREVESNEGNLIADAQKWMATVQAPSYGMPFPDVALQNGGGIRNNTIIPAGPISELDTFDMVPFANFVSIVPDIPREQFKEIMENAVACVLPADLVDNPNCGTGRFAQISGFEFVYSTRGEGMIQDVDGNLVRPGTRVLEIVLDDGTIIVSDGEVQPGANITVATIDFLANGGDQYPFRGAPYTSIGATYQQALAQYIELGLAGLIRSSAYPEGGEGRITRIDYAFIPAVASP